MDSVPSATVFPRPQGSNDNDRITHIARPAFDAGGLAGLIVARYGVHGASDAVNDRPSDSVGSHDWDHDAYRAFGHGADDRTLYPAVTVLAVDCCADECTDQVGHSLSPEKSAPVNAARLPLFRLGNEQAGSVGQPVDIHCQVAIREDTADRDGARRARLDRAFEHRLFLLAADREQDRARRQDRRL